ncbi:MAG: M48 family metallopeptidase, partial [Candidatus Binatia bacterium]
GTRRARRYPPVGEGRGALNDGGAAEGVAGWWRFHYGLRMSARRSLAASSIAWLLALAACAELIQPVARVNLLGVEQEREISAQFAAEVEAKQPVVRDAEVGGYVAELGGRLAGALREREFTYRFRAVEDPSVNAFNIGGGYVYVHTGLLAAADTEGQVASVLAHEIGHQVERHVAKAISREQLFQTLAQVAVGPNASQWVQLGAGLGILTGQLHFGREAERDADGVMVVLMTRAGYDPNEALGMFEKLRALDGRQPGKVAKLFSSHPPTGERLEAVRKHIARMSLPPDLVRDSQRFQEVRRRVKAG